MRIIPANSLRSIARLAAELLDELALLRGGDHADGVGAGELAELQGEHAEAAGGAPDQDAVAGLQLGTA